MDEYRDMKTRLNEVSEQVKALEREIIGHLDRNEKLMVHGFDRTMVSEYGETVTFLYNGGMA